MAQFGMAVASCCLDPKSLEILSLAKIRALDQVRNMTDNPVVFAADVQALIQAYSKNSSFHLREEQFEDMKRLSRFAAGTEEAQLLRSRWVPPDLDLADYGLEPPNLGPALGTANKAAPLIFPSPSSGAPEWRGPRSDLKAA